MSTAQLDGVHQACLKFKRGGAQNSNLFNGPGRAEAGTSRADTFRPVHISNLYIMETHYHE